MLFSLFIAFFRNSTRKTTNSGLESVGHVISLPLAIKGMSCLCKRIVVLYFSPSTFIVVQIKWKCAVVNPGLCTEVGLLSAHLAENQNKLGGSKYLEVVRSVNSPLCSSLCVFRNERCCVTSSAACASSVHVAVAAAAAADWSRMLRS